MGIIEAMAGGLPVVSFDCPWGPRSIIEDGKDGILVENGNIHLMAAAMLSLMMDKGRLSFMAQNARINVSRFRIEHIAEKWVHLFDDLYRSKE
jgi:glycosyltransferase involved in cell wall biosynthesis